MNYFQKRNFKKKQRKVFKQWKRDCGDQTLRLDYDLNELSVVLDVGGFEGQWASDLYSKYNCQIYVFEPISCFAEKIQERFENNKNIKVFDLGLGGETREEKISLSGDASSIYQNSGNLEVIKIKDINTWLKEEGIDSIDLIKINIEGGEYELLDRILSVDFAKNIGDIQVQFHNIEEASEEKMHQIQKLLSKSHLPTYQYKFIWENWRKK